jgi:hypothetical protein
MIHLPSKLEDGFDLVLFVLLEDGKMYMELKPQTYILMRNFYLL